ncbi:MULTISPECIES: hypothetical protein [unclassified Leptolyngbya]|uniref:hypothetical protein n=1 Tax=unclassified Leptolyngbya TaxID=2650499 RepID=UPI001684B978|nr:MULTISPECIES: hypothetical protein [unclassified Leptolyngbya]MBD1911779.1 hypothetical protein [Leptolyngbya sp. FACHB-8]MBD2153331.1 hypothetical protein [Leptolyngbya sp. FACHB-16]
MFGFAASSKESFYTEPQVYYRSDRQGRTWWDIRNPVTGHITRVATEEEARIRIEKSAF